MGIEKTFGKAKSAIGDAFAKGVHGIEATGKKVIGKGAPKFGGKGIALSVAGVALLGAGAFFFFTAPGKRMRKQFTGMISKWLPDFGEGVLENKPAQAATEEPHHLNSWERRQRAPMPEPERV